MTHANLAAALAAFQTELPTINKGNEAKVPTKSGGEYKYKYADLADISPKVLPLLGKHGMAFTSRPTLRGNDFVLHYMLTHESGETVEGEYPLPSPDTLPQTLGSAITYARRYALCAVTGVAPGGDDDDAAAAQTAPPRRTAARKPAEAPKPEAPTFAAENWAARIVDVSTVDELRAVHEAAAAAGELGLAIDPKFQTHVDGMVDLFGLARPNGPVRVGQAITAVKAAIEANAAAAASPIEPPEGETTEWETTKPGEGVAFK